MKKDRNGILKNPKLTAIGSPTIGSQHNSAGQPEKRSNLSL